MLNNVIIMGRITRDLELKTTNGGHAVVSFSIATDRNYKENGEYPTDFFEIVAWRKTAEFICKYFSKGQLIAIDGTLQTRSYVDSNNITRKVTEINVDSAFFCGEKKEPANNNGYGQPPVNYGQPPVYDGEFENIENPFEENA